MQLVRSFAVGREAHAGAKRVQVFNVSSLQAHPAVDGVLVVRVSLRGCVWWCAHWLVW